MASIPDSAKDECWECNKPLDVDQSFKCQINKCEHIFCGRHYIEYGHKCCTNNEENEKEKEEEKEKQDDIENMVIMRLFHEYIKQCNMDCIDVQNEGVQAITNLLTEQEISRIDIMNSDITDQLLNILSNTTDINTKINITFILCELLDLDQSKIKSLDNRSCVEILIDQQIISTFLDLLCNDYGSNTLNRNIIIGLTTNSQKFIERLIEHEPMDKLNKFLDECLEIKDNEERNNFLKDITETVTNIISRTSFPKQMHKNQSFECFKMMKAVRLLLNSTNNEDIILPITSMYGYKSKVKYKNNSMIIELINMEKDVNMKLCDGFSKETERNLDKMIPIDVIQLLFKYLYITDNTMDLLMDLLSKHKRTKRGIVCNVIRTISNIIALCIDDNIAMNLVFNHDLLKIFKYNIHQSKWIIDHRRKFDAIQAETQCIKEILNAISNIISDKNKNTMNCIQIMIDKGIMVKIIDLLLNIGGYKFGVTMGIEALWCITNCIFVATLEQITFIIDNNALDAFVVFLQRFRSDLEAMDLILNAMEFVLSQKIFTHHFEASGAIDILQEIQSKHIMYQTVSKTIYDKTCHILEMYSLYHNSLSV